MNRAESVALVESVIADELETALFEPWEQRPPLAVRIVGQLMDAWNYCEAKVS